MNDPNTNGSSRSAAVGRLAAAAFVVLLTISACGKTETAGLSVLPQNTVAPAAAEAGSAAAPAGGASDAADDEIDVCSLLTDSEIKAIIGVHSKGHGGSVECSWQNEDTYDSVTIHIGGVGTSPDGQLPEPLPGAKTAPGPDGIRYSSGNEVDFLIGDRACEIEVITSVTDESDRPAAVRLVGLLRSRVKA